MPIVTRVSRNLSPLEEEAQCRGAPSGGEGEGVFVTLGTSILTTRLCNPKDGSHSADVRKRPPKRSLSVQECEVFLPITEQTLPSMESQMQYLWSQGVPMCIEVKGQVPPPAGVASSEDLPSVLLEQWLIQVLPKRPHSIPYTTPQLLTQAVRSFLHFSQIRSWVVSNKGALPFDLVYRVCAPGEGNWDPEQFTLCEPEKHVFPAAALSPHTTLHITITYLPRLEHIPAILLADGPKQRQRLRHKQADTNMRSMPQGTTKLVPQGTSKLVPKAASTMSIPEQIVERTSALRISGEPQAPSAGSKSIKTNVNPREVFPFSPPQPSPMSPKLLSGLGDRLPYCSFSREVATQREERTCSGTHGSLSESAASTAGTSSRGVGWLPDCSHESCFCFEQTCVGQDCCRKSGCDCKTKVAPCFEQTCVGQDCYRKSGCDCKTKVAPSRDKFSDCSCRMEEREGVVYRRPQSPGTTGAAEPSSSPPRMRVRPPAASSPIPFVVGRSNSESKHHYNLQAHRRSCAITIKHSVRPLLRSNSAPATVPSLYLLGTFEESMLNGRLEPCGFVEGFTAEIGASGSFCPRHLKLPVTAAFFSLSDDGGPSPYLGHIDLSDVGKRGYHVPKKGTVQVTLFNPNKTVVKIFVVTFDLSDMPPNSQTFLRQKILSRPYHTHTGARGIPAIHYLIHLRFLCSKSGRVYLHTDIRLIFARRAPDTDPDMSKVSLTTVTEGPSNPKYGPLEAGK